MFANGSKKVSLVGTETVYDTARYPWTIQTYSDGKQIQFRDVDCERGDASMISWELGKEPEWFRNMVIDGNDEMALCPDWYRQNPMPPWWDLKQREFFMCSDSDSDSDEEDGT